MSRRPHKSFRSDSPRLLAPAAKKPESDYLADIRRFSLLEREQNTDSPSAGGSMAIARLRTRSSQPSASVSQIARITRGYGLPLSEIISKAMSGLMQAVNRFEPRGASALLLCDLWIKASIQTTSCDPGRCEDGHTANQKKLL